jgi:L-fucose isomerase-like protein
VTPEAFAQHCREAYGQTFGTHAVEPCREDHVTLTDISECVERFRQSEFLIVGRGTPGQTRDFLGATAHYIGFEELLGHYEKVDGDEAADWGQRWSDNAQAVMEPEPASLQKAGGVYLAILELLKKYHTDSITMNCLGGFAQGSLPAYPCLGFMQLLNDGGQGVCEAMPDDTLSMMMARILTGRPGFVSDPALDTSKNQIVYAHCVGNTKPFGPEGASNRYRIRTLHNRDPRGCCSESLLPSGYMTTTFRTNAARQELIVHQARAVGTLDSEYGCRTKLIGEVTGDIGKLFDQWDQFGWHRVTVYGDVMEPLIEFGEALGLQVLHEA